MKERYGIFFIAMGGLLLGLCFFALLCGGFAGGELASLSGQEREFRGVVIRFVIFLAVPVLFIYLYYKTK